MVALSVWLYLKKSLIVRSPRRGGSRERVQGVRTLPPRDDPRFSNTTGILQKKKKTMWFICVEIEAETCAPPPKKILDPPLPRE